MRPLCVAHGRLHCLCAADVEEACLFWEDDGTEASFAELGGEEEMHVLCSFAFVGAEKSTIEWSVQSEFAPVLRPASAGTPPNELRRDARTRVKGCIERRTTSKPSACVLCVPFQRRTAY